MRIRGSSVEQIVFGVLMALVVFGSIWASYNADRQVQLEARQLLDEKADRLIEKARRAIEQDQKLFEAARTLIDHSDEVTDEEWRDFLSSYRLHNRTEGLENLAYSPLVTRAPASPGAGRADAADSNGDFAVLFTLGSAVDLKGEGDERGSNNGESLATLDLFALPSLRAAMKESAEKNSLVLATIEEGMETTASRFRANETVLVFAVYQDFSFANYSLENAQGFLHGRISLDKLFADVASSEEDISLDVYDAPGPGEAPALFADPRAETEEATPYKHSRIEDTRTVVLANRPLTFRFATRPQFGGEIDHSRPVVILLTGLAIALVCFVALRLLWRSKRKAEEIAADRKRDLAQSQARFQSILDNAGDGICRLNAKGEITFANKAAQTILGHCASGLMHKSFAAVTQVENSTKDTAGLVDATIARTLAEGLTLTREDVRFRTRPGQTIAAEFTCAPICEDGDKIAGAVIVFRDTTRRVEAEESLRAANAELEEFAYRTSHDLRSPLVSGIALLKIAATCVERGENDKALKSLQLTIGSLQGLENLVGDILMLSRTKNAEEPEASISPAGLIDEALSKMANMDNFDRIDVRRQFDFTGEVVTKENRIRLIIENLVSNAVKYQDPAEPQPFLRIATYRDAGEIIIEIEDNGLGIPEEQRANLFSMFSRFHPKTSFGSGLGLYMVKKSVEIIGGRIEYAPADKGTKFEVILPHSNDTALAA